ncbi:hypothetical protein ISN45_Aa07g012030 [Arabidopsis thaliana x Arabidopsis arenosa]|uniref:Uncharacterized protein n=1 Tax=Arabidopsis thaliana x Arabidopsis arenosa TaxID=1240361 RepID=A0A8T1YB97_9BRAS|nr:hypothetical protein ISN45_Aa07g012030 [Arabidopsis thaliana x Arabidopsis arenosa]
MAFTLLVLFPLAGSDFLTVDGLHSNNNTNLSVSVTTNANPCRHRHQHPYRRGVAVTTNPRRRHHQRNHRPSLSPLTHRQFSYRISGSVSLSVEPKFLKSEQ